MPEQDTYFTIPKNKIKTRGQHVTFALYANGAKNGDLCMTKPEFEIFKATICEDTLHEHNFDLGMKISELHNLKRAGWKMLCVARMKFWHQNRHAYEQNINDAGDFPFAVAKAQVDESNVALHDESAKLVGAEELLIYHPTRD